MDRRKFLIMAGAAISGFNLYGQNNSTEPPNIIWLIADDAGWNDFGCYGNSVVKTPNIDGLAQQGLKFTQAFVTSPQCSPSRASFWTGKYAHSMGVEDLHSPLTEKEKIFPEYLKKKNYHTGNVGKLHLGKPSKEKFDFISRDIDDWKKFLNKRPTQNPFFLALGFHQPHRPFKYKNISHNYSRQNIIVPPYLPKLKQVKQDFTRYYNEITKMDVKIGSLLNYLSKKDLKKDTLIIFWSDNGLPFPRAKGLLYDPGIRSPLIFYWKNKIQHGVCRQLTSILDIVPTLLEMLNIHIPQEIQGESFLQTLDNINTSYREFIYAERNWHDLDDHIRAVRSTRYKFIRNYLPWRPYTLPADVYNSPTFRAMKKAKRKGLLSKHERLLFRWPRPPEELYDLAKDPNEFNNLANKKEYEEIQNKLRKQLQIWEERTDDVPVDKRKPDKYNYHKLFNKSTMDIQD